MQRQQKTAGLTQGESGQDRQTAFIEAHQLCRPSVAIRGMLKISGAYATDSPSGEKNAMLSSAQKQEDHLCSVETATESTQRTKRAEREYRAPTLRKE